MIYINSSIRYNVINYGYILTQNKRKPVAHSLWFTACFIIIIINFVTVPEMSREPRGYDCPSGAAVEGKKDFATCDVSEFWTIGDSAEGHSRSNGVRAAARRDQQLRPLREYGTLTTLAIINPFCKYRNYQPAFVEKEYIQSNKNIRVSEQASGRCRGADDVEEVIDFRHLYAESSFSRMFN